MKKIIEEYGIALAYALIFAILIIVALAVLNFVSTH